MARKNFTFDFYVDGIHVTTVEELLKTKNHENAIREVYQQIEQLENGGNSESDYFEDFGPVTQPHKFTEETADEPSDSSRIISRNSPQINTIPSTISTIPQKHTANCSDTYFFSLHLMLTSILFSVVFTKQYWQ
uniref:Uncharacterized protein n=1 Tax=Syphacia muris TaxID=451379 RepID=A0A0N5B0U3_9BILA